MARLRYSRPGVIGPTFVDLGPATGRTSHTRGAVTGGVLVVAHTPKPTVSQAARAKDTARKAEERRREKLAARPTTPCGRWIILARAACARRARHSGSCTTAERLARLAEARRAC
jgi:hypothetical protein